MSELITDLTVEVFTLWNKSGFSKKWLSVDVVTGLVYELIS